MSLRTAAALVGMWMASSCAMTLWAQQPGPDLPPATYRRIFVPQEELETQVKGLLPLKREEFERRLPAAGKADATSAAIRISRAQYTARLVGQQLVDGQATWEVAAPADASGTLKLDPCNLALGSANWLETPPRRAVLAIGSRNVLTLRVDKPGVVTLPWTRRGQEVQEGVTHFDLQLPSASRQSLRLELPERLQLTAEPGLALRSDKPVADGIVEWLVELGGMTHVKLRISEQGPARISGNLVLVKEQDRYALTPTDLVAEFQFQVDVHGEPLKTAQFRVDPRLKITAVSVGQRAVPWSVAADDQTRTLSVEFPEPLTGGNYSVSIQAASPFTSAQRYRLPRLAWGGAVWQEGSCTLSVPPALQVAVTDAIACRETKGPPAAGGESLGFQYHSADGYVEIEALPRRARLAAVVGVSVQFDATQVSATLRADVTSQEGEAFDVDAVVSNAWILDSVETVPADLLEDRPVILQDEHTKTMRLKLVRPITPQRPLKLVVRARLQQRLPPDLTSAALWRWFRLQGTIERSAVLALRNNIANYDLQVAGDINAVRLDPEASSNEELGLLDAPPSGLLFRLPPDASDFQVMLRQGEPRYSAAWEVTCATAEGRLRQEVAVRCTPSGPGLSRLKVRSTPPPDREIRWRVTGVPDASIVAQTRHDTGPSPSSPLAEAVWELELSRPLAQPFTLETSWESPRNQHHSVALFACVEATTQSGRVLVTAEDDDRWTLAASGLSALPVPSEHPDRFTLARGLFRYQPGRQASLAVVPASADKLLPLARIQSVDLTTQFAADASGLHILSLTLENSGLGELPVRLPLAATLQEVTVEGRSLEPLLTPSQPRQFRIPLPADERHIEVRVTYATAPQERPHYFATWRAELPEMSLAVPPVAWHVALPPGVRAVADLDAANWDQQLQTRFWGAWLNGSSWTRWLHPWRKGAVTIADDTPQSLAAELSPAFASAGWLHLSQQRPWSPALTVGVYEPSRLALYGSLLALWSAGLVLLAPRSWTKCWIFWGALLAAAVLTVPISMASLIAGAFWGITAGGMATLLRPSLAVARNSQASRATTARWIAGAGAAVILLFVVLATGDADRAAAAPAEGGNRNENDASAKYRVVIPVDDERQPVGDYVFVDEKFYQRLFEQGDPGMTGEPWQIFGASYEVRWSDAAQGGTPAAGVRASLEIETLTADTQITLPFRRPQVLLQQGGARLDGNPLAVNWREDGNGLVAEVPVPGRYRLDLAFSTPLTEADGQRELALSIPRAPRAMAHVSLPVGTATPISPTSLGSQIAGAAGAGPAWQFDLGAAAELSLRVSNSDESSPQQAVEAEAFLWWKVRPGSVVVETAAKFRPLSGSLRQVQLRFGPHLRLLPLDGLPQGSRQWVESGITNTLHVEFAEPIDDEVVIRPRFLLGDASGIGKVVVPRVEPVASRITRHWLAATPGPGLELVMPQPSGVAVAPADFAQAMGVAGAAPQAAFDLAGNPAISELEFRPETRAPLATAQTTIFCGLRLSRLLVELDLTDLASHHLQQRVAIPPGWTVTQVTVRDSDLPVRSRWFQESDGTVVVRLDQPPGSSQQVQIEATLAPAAGVPIVLPAVHVLGARDAGQTLNVVRSHDCAVAVAETVGWEVVDGGDVDRPQAGAGRLVTHLRGQPGAARRQTTVQISANRPQVSARLVTRYVRTASASAEAMVVCDLEISAGKLDAIRLEAPPEWSGPYETSPPLAVQTVVIPGQARRHLTLIPDEPLTGKAQFVIRSPLRPTAREPLRVPDIAPIDAVRVERFVQLPKLAEGESAKWEVAGLQAVPLPTELNAEQLSGNDYETLAVKVPHFDAVLTAADAPRVEPLLSLAEYRAAWHTSGLFHGEATFYLDVSRLETCSLDFPPAVEPTFATLDGIPAEVRRETKSRWKLRLPRNRLPQILTVGFLGSLRPEGEQLALAGPILVGLKAQATIWSLELPDSLTVADSALTKDGEILRLDQDMLRLASALELLRRAENRDVPGLSSDALADWMRPWQIATSAAAQRARTAFRTLVKVEGAREATFHKLQSQLDRQSQLLQGERLSNPPAETQRGMDALSPGTQRLGGAFGDQQSQVTMTVIDRNAGKPPQRRLVALLLTLLGAMTWLLTRAAVVSDWLSSSGPFLLAILGTLLATLSPLGVVALVLVGAGVIVACRSPWRRGSREQRSSVVRVTRRSRPSHNSV